MAGIGGAANIMNICLPLVDILPLGEKTKVLWKELAQGLARIFFSSRRCINGNKWLKNNPEKEQIQNFNGVSKNIQLVADLTR